MIFLNFNLIFRGGWEWRREREKNRYEIDTWIGCLHVPQPGPGIELVLNYVPLTGNLPFSPCVDALTTENPGQGQMRLFF